MVRGYEEIQTANDKGMLLTSMRTRLANSLIYGLRTVRINYRSVDVEYVMKTQDNGWKVLKVIPYYN